MEQIGDGSPRPAVSAARSAISRAVRVTMRPSSRQTTRSVHSTRSMTMAPLDSLARTATIPRFVYHSAMRLPILAIPLVLVAASASAHDTWLLPTQFEARPGVAVTAHATSAMHFPEPETPVRPERLVRTGVRLGDRTNELTPGVPAGTALSLQA